MYDIQINVRISDGDRVSYMRSITLGRNYNNIKSAQAELFQLSQQDLIDAVANEINLYYEIISAEVILSPGHKIEF